MTAAQALQHSPSLDAAAVAEAALRIKGRVARTPFLRAERLSDSLGAEIWLKLECLQYTGAYKERGAFNRLLRMSASERAAGVITASAGNHAQGLARAARALSTQATIIMPVTTPEVKIRRTRDLGATVELSGETFDEAQSHARALERRYGFAFVHPFDDPDIIAGQGTVGLEMIEDGPALDAVIAPIGGGGLIAGMSLIFAQEAPQAEIIGVQAALFPSMANAVTGASGACGGNTLAEGIAVREAGVLTRQIVRDHVDDIALVDERVLERALSVLMNEQKVLVEGAGAAGLAAVLADPGRFKGRRIGIVLSGGNIDQRLLSMILMRDLARSGRLARLRVQLLDMPGQLVRVASIIARQDGNVIDVGHHRTYSDLPAKMTCMDVTLDTQGQAHLDRIIADLQREGYPVEIAAY
jgi:threonine dehydratase